MAYIDRYNSKAAGTGGFVDYYTGRPTVETGDPIDNIPELPLVETPIDPRYVLKQQGDNNNGGLTPDQEIESRVGLDGLVVGNVNYDDIKYKSFDEYLNTTAYQMDKSGIFSSIDFGKPTKDAGMSTARKFGTAETLIGLLPIGGAIISQFDTRVVQSALGQDVFVQKKGIGNLAETARLTAEYDDLNTIKNDKMNNMAVPEEYDYLNYDYGYGMPVSSTDSTLVSATESSLKGMAVGFQGDKEGIADIKSAGDNLVNVGQGKGFAGDTGYAFTLGGNQTAYRMKGSSIYKGLPKGITQQVAKSVEALQQGFNPYNYDPNSNNNETIVNANDKNGTLKGGYTLSGNFVSPNGQTAMMGWMDDFTNMARNNFSKNTNLTTKQVNSFARGWLESARSLPRNATAKEKLDNLNNWKSKAMGVTKAKKAKMELYRINKGLSSRREKEEEKFKKTTATFSSPEQSKAAATRGGDYGVGSKTYSNFGTVQDSGGDGFDSGGVGQGGDSYGGLDFAEGGQVGMAEGDQVAPEMQEGTMVEPSIQGQDDGDMVLSASELLEGEPESGFIRKPASQTTDEEGVTDNNPTLAPNEKNPRGAAIVINKQAVDQMGEQDAVKMIEEARAYLRSKGGKEGTADSNGENPEGMSEIITADGEIMIQPEEADVIGRKKLLALNERGKGATRAVKKKVKPKQEGFITANEGLEVSSIDPDRFNKVWKEYKPLIRGGTQAQNNNKSRDKAQRLLKQFTDQELLAFVMLSEGSTLGEKGAEGIAHIILNRINSEEKDFSKIEDVYSAITKRQKGKEGNKVFQFQGLEPTPLKKYLRLLNEKDPATTKKYKQYVNIADEVIAGSRKDFTNNSTFFWDPRNSTDPFMLKSVKSGSLIAQGSTKVGNFLHQYLKMAGENKQSTMPNEKEIIREGQYTAMTENYMNRINKNQPKPNFNAQSQGGGFISQYNNNRAKPLATLN